MQADPPANLDDAKQLADGLGRAVVPAALFAEADARGGLILNGCSASTWQAAVELERLQMARIHHRADDVKILMCLVHLNDR
ncbi:MAG: hypothetical protein AAF663_00385 [Planctomycetota bacterium]